MDIKFILGALFISVLIVFLYLNIRERVRNKRFKERMELNLTLDKLADKVNHLEELLAKNIKNNMSISFKDALDFMHTYSYAISLNLDLAKYFPESYEHNKELLKELYNHYCHIQPIHDKGQLNDTKIHTD